MSGPYDTETDVHIEVRDIYASHAKHGVMRARTHHLITRVCAEHGLELGEYDREVLRWLARQPPERVQVIADLIDRASAAARDRA
ncbi:hypothetical protein DZF91_36570 [Actinomadura logoneensis]|uniref:Uncharacterized protein n=1 Tax=Actinomadura logoneensis TaxID=2293572 RepID=A0A372JAA9_9ACTN|nr:hypothetical protein [Actinomadura logoneensis]RFU36744.1 hypothetical protein DZF91_36570 [Actinomadura logoneensis]